MNFPSIDIQGSILSTDLLAKIRSEQATFQQGKDFNPDLTNAKLKDEISLAWQEAKGQWTIYKSKLTRLKEGETGTTETRNFWISPLLTNLGYNLTFDRKSEELNGKLFPIGYRDSNLDNFPIYAGGYHESLDKRPENKQLRVSPHAMLQEYLNYSEHLYGMVTNGRQLRLLRDASRITRLSYVEFNLEKMMEEDLYSDFVILYRVLHASRMPKRIDGGAESIMEKYHQEGLEAGSTIRNKLGEAVKGAIKNLANGFINHPYNAALREAVAAGNINADEYYRHQLRIIYRLLFLFVIEERNLVYADSKTPETKRFNHIYFNYYSLLRLRKLAKKLLPPEASRHYDLWQSLISTFSLFEKKEIGEKLGIMALQGDLFGYHAISGNGYDLHQCYLSNAVLLNIIKSLSYFENDNGVLIAVNYGGLDVEEFGSVYEGLLELKLEVKKIEGSDQYSCSFDTSNERGKSGSHYTPEELVQPLIKHSLEYLIEDRLKPYQQKKASKEATAQSLLNLKIADVACGSGHILLSAARRLSLEIARVQTEEEQPNPVAIRKAMKDVVRNCIYGVDKNPLAVELCKIALWLEAYNPGEPLNFLDHHIKCGDAIVGLAHRSELENGIADEAFKTLPGDDAAIAKTWRDKNIKERKERAAKALQLKAEFEKSTESSVQEAMAEYKTFSQLPETTPEEIERKAKAYQKFIDGKGFTFLKAMADTQCAQFFIPKTEANKDYLMTDADYRMILSGYKGWQDRKVAKATALAHEQRFFHWFIEFPEVFNERGFDCVLGNPPFRGGLYITNDNSPYYTNFIKTNTSKAGSTTDLVAYFFRRDFSIVSDDGFISLIGTNSISEGDTRETCLESIIEKGGKITFASKSVRWPGEATLHVSLISITKKVNWNLFVLNNANVSFINSWLTDSNNQRKPFCLKQLEEAFLGTTVYGKGFFISEDQKAELISINLNHARFIKPFLNGDDVLNHPASKNSRYVLYFQGLDQSYLTENYPELFEFAYSRIFAERQKSSSKGRREKWWLYTSPADDIYRSIIHLQFVIATCFTSKHPVFAILPKEQIFSNALVIVCSDSYARFGCLQSSFHSAWVQEYGSTLETRQRYAVSDVYNTFPFPNLNDEIKNASFNYLQLRNSIQKTLNYGLTDLYNEFNNSSNSESQFGSLRELHVAVDNAVLLSYGWSDITLLHDFYEVDYLPENDRVRFTIHPDARKEVLKRLLELNHKIHEEEKASGLLDKKKTVSKKSNAVDKPKVGYGGDLFNQE
jgi:type I restriction-modification system DNA methylase subunit